MKALPFRRTGGFTLLELLTVIAIIIVLAGLILAGAGFAQQKAARDRASAEIAALSVALESYKADNGVYPRDSATDGLNSSSATAPAAAASLYLYKELSGDKDANRVTDANEKRYFEFKPDMLQPATGTITSLVDPFGNAYGYSTILAAGMEKATPDTSKGYNPTFDLYSTGGAPTIAAKWITNW